MWIAPCTEYLLTFMLRVDNVQGDGPYVEFILHDYNTDDVATNRYSIGIEKPTNGWLKKEFTLKVKVQ